ncbi:restriction endonuclease subunit S [Pseudomonas sp. PE-S1G-1]|uniref:restriction endonuclease subunit S n=1 Tax=Pseudomonas sp. PE-S1G-1 TaxID=1986995 RepID=UPI00130379D4|nr:restriction endonuclease subunit S [Pseudomonas sp. PE-S1G-1]
MGAALIKITDGTHHSPPNGESGDFLYISAKNIKHEGVLLDNATYVTKEVHDEIYARCNPEPGDILYIKDGATTGITTINNLSEPFSMLSSVALLKCPTKILNKYLLLALRSPFFYAEMRAGMTGIAITRVTIKKLGNALIPIPPIKEQHRIVEKVSKLMTLCDQLKSCLSKAQTIQLHLADSAVYEVIGEQISNIEVAQDSTEIMKITTTLSLNHEKFDELAIIAPIILELGGSADAKDVWNRTKLSLPEFYAQLKTEIDANYVSKPARADF